MCLVFFFSAFGAEQILRPPTWGWSFLSAQIFFLTWFDFDWPPHGVVWPRRIVAWNPCYLVLVRPWNSCCVRFVGKDKPPRSMGPMLSKQRKTNLSGTMKLDKIMGSWTFMEEIKTLQQLKMTENDSLLSFSAIPNPAPQPSFGALNCGWDLTFSDKIRDHFCFNVEIL